MRFGWRVEVSRRVLLGGAVAGLAARRGLSADEPGLRILCWPGVDHPAVVDALTRGQGITVDAEPIAADDELFLFLRAGGLRQVGVVTPTNGSVQALAAAELIQPLDLERIPNARDRLQPFANPDWARMNGTTYAVPLTWRTSPLAFAEGAEFELPRHWLDLFDQRFNERLVMLDDVVGHFVTWNRAFGLVDPVRVTKEQLAETANLLMDLKGNQVRLFTFDLSEAADALDPGLGWATTSGHDALARDGRVALAHLLPGDYAVCSSAALPAGAPDPDAAYAFINHLLAPETQATLSRVMRQGVVNAQALTLLEDGDQRLFRYGELDAVFATSPFGGMPPFEDADPQIATYVDWVRAWDRVRFARTSLDPRPTPAPAPSATDTAAPAST